MVENPASEVTSAKSLAAGKFPGPFTASPATVPEVTLALIVE